MGYTASLGIENLEVFLTAERVADRVFLKAGYGTLKDKDLTLLSLSVTTPALPSFGLYAAVFLSVKEQKNRLV